MRLETPLYTGTLLFAGGGGDAGGSDLLVARGRCDAGIVLCRRDHCLRPGPRSCILHAPWLLCRCGGLRHVPASGSRCCVWCSRPIFSLPRQPEDLENGSGVLVLLALSVADLSRILAAACVGIALARYITSVGVVLIIVLAAIASDLFSVFAGPTRVLVQEHSPILDALLLAFPTFGSALGFGLGVSDLIFLALFAAAGRFLDLRYSATLLGLCFAAFLAVTAGLLLQRPLPALPFIAIAFVIINADLIVTSLVKSR